MNQMEIFKNPEFGSIRVIEENGKYLFCGLDIATALGYAKPRNAINSHCRYALKRGVPDSNNHIPKMATCFTRKYCFGIFILTPMPRFRAWVKL